MHSSTPKRLKHSPSSLRRRLMRQSLRLSPKWHPHLSPSLSLTQS